MSWYDRGNKFEINKSNISRRSGNIWKLDITLLSGSREMSRKLEKFEYDENTAQQNW